MSNDVKENVLSYKHIRNFRREIETTKKQQQKKKMIELKYIIWKKKLYWMRLAEEWR